MTDEKAFEAYLTGDTEISRLYRTGATESAPEPVASRILAHAAEPPPSDARDDSPTAGARRAPSRPRAVPRLRPRADRGAPAWTRWVPTSAVATLAAAVVLGIHLGTEVERGAPSPPVPPPSRAADPVPPPAAAPAPPSEVPSPAASVPSVTRSTSTGTNSEHRPPAGAVPVAAPQAHGPSEPTSTPASAPEWLTKIEQLLEQGLQDEARAAFYAFREQYPYHPLPDGLLQRLGM